MSPGHIEASITIPRAQNGPRRGDLYWSPETPNIITVAAALLSETANRSTRSRAISACAAPASATGASSSTTGPIRPLGARTGVSGPSRIWLRRIADALRTRIGSSMALGFNACRIHQKVEDPSLPLLGRSSGLLVWGVNGQCL